MEDVKSPATKKEQVYVMKKKLMKDWFGINIHEV